MTTYTVTGGKILHGNVELHGAKNAGFKAMIASLLADSPSTICGLGLISEIDFATRAITALGGKIIPQTDRHCLSVDPTKLNSFSVPVEIGEKSRASNLYAPSLLAKFGKAVLPIPGGDRIGKRPLERHFAGLETMGARINIGSAEIVIEADKGLRGVTYSFPKNTHTGTEFLIMAAVKADGTTVLENAAAEPEVDDLIKFLNSLGGRIERVAARTIKIVGVKELHGGKHTVMKDRNEAVTFACCALATHGRVNIVGGDPKVLEAFLVKVSEAGGRYHSYPGGLEFTSSGKLQATSVTTAPYPAFMTDWQPLWSTLMTQAQGQSVVHETVYEKRFDYVPSLLKMGAKIVFFEPKLPNPDAAYNFNLSDDTAGNQHAIKIFGPTKLSGQEIEVNDVRSGATALMAGLIASGQTKIIDPRDQIKRGYEDLVENLNGLGAQIQTEDENGI